MIQAFYNDTDRYCCDWLSNLIDAGEITPGVIDDRPIQELTPDDVKGYNRAHFFAGVGGWDIALNLARWPDTRPVWTGSCPCQPFSAAGQGKAGDDKRHLWPAWASLIAQCRPGTVFGEQVEAAIGWGWLDLVFADLEAEGYACGSAVLPAYSVGAPHIRNRLWFVADAVRPGRPKGRAGTRNGSVAGSGIAGRLGDTDSAGSQGRRVDAGEYAGQRTPRAASASFWSDAEWLPCSDGKARPVKSSAQCMADGVSGAMGLMRSNRSAAKEIANAAQSIGLAEQALSALRDGYEPHEVWRSLGGCLGFSEAAVLLACLCEHSWQLGQFFRGETSSSAQSNQAALREMQWPAPTAARPSFGWRLSEQFTGQLANAMSLLPQARALASFNGFPLAHGVLRRPSKLRAYGNAIVPQVAAEMIGAFMDLVKHRSKK